VSNSNPWQARLARALKRKPGDIDAIRRRTWAALCLAFDEIADAADADQRRKALLCYSQLAGTYVKLWELAELEGRVRALEASAGQRRTHPWATGNGGSRH
jgi:hypothetical protein